MLVSRIGAAHERMLTARQAIREFHCENSSDLTRQKEFMRELSAATDEFLAAADNLLNSVGRLAIKPKR